MTSFDAAFFEGKTVVVTGGTGSFGELLLRALLTTQAREVQV